MAVFYKNGHKKSRSHDQRENGIYEVDKYGSMVVQSLPKRCAL